MWCNVPYNTYGRIGCYNLTAAKSQLWLSYGEKSLVTATWLSSFETTEVSMIAKSMRRRRSSIYHPSYAWSYTVCIVHRTPNHNRFYYALTMTRQADNLLSASAPLRLSRQAYNESVWLLYVRTQPFSRQSHDRNQQKVQARFTSPSCTRMVLYCTKRSGLPAPRKPDIFPYQRRFYGEKEQSLIYPHCFRRLRHIWHCHSGRCG